MRCVNPTQGGASSFPEFQQMETLPFVRQFATQFFARHFTDTGAYFYLLARMSGGTVLSYSSFCKRSRTLGRAEANYHALVSQSTPATPAQIVAEFDSYATTVNVRGCCRTPEKAG